MTKKNPTIEDGTNTKTDGVVTNINNKGNINMNMP